MLHARGKKQKREIGSAYEEKKRNAKEGGKHVAFHLLSGKSLKGYDEVSGNQSVA